MLVVHVEHAVKILLRTRILSGHQRKCNHAVTMCFGGCYFIAVSPGPLHADVVTTARCATIGLLYVFGLPIIEIISNGSIHLQLRDIVGFYLAAVIFCLREWPQISFGT